MFIKQKKLMSKCRACGNESQLDDTHRAGTQLMKNLPKDMSEIDSKKKDKKKKKKKAEQPEEDEKPSEEEGIKLDSEEIGKCSIDNTNST